jgi:hypothetical protein
MAFAIRGSVYIRVGKSEPTVGFRSSIDSLINFIFINGIQSKISPDPEILGEHSHLLELLFRDDLFTASLSSRAMLFHTPKPADGI